MIQFTINPDNVATVIATGAGMIVAFVVGFKKIITMMTKEKKETTALNGEIEVINLLREQIADLAKANRELRVEIDALRDLNQNLIIENESFKEEIRALKRYIENHFQDKE